MILCANSRVMSLGNGKMPKLFIFRPHTICSYCGLGHAGKNKISLGMDKRKFQYTINISVWNVSNKIIKSMVNHISFYNVCICYSHNYFSFCCLGNRIDKIFDF